MSNRRRPCWCSRLRSNRITCASRGIVAEDFGVSLEVDRRSQIAVDPIDLEDDARRGRGHGLDGLAGRQWLDDVAGRRESTRDAVSVCDPLPLLTKVLDMP